MVLITMSQKCLSHVRPFLWSLVAYTYICVRVYLYIYISFLHIVTVSDDGLGMLLIDHICLCLCIRLCWITESRCERVSGCMFKELVIGSYRADVVGPSSSSGY